MAIYNINSMISKLTMSLQLKCKFFFCNKQKLRQQQMQSRRRAQQNIQISKLNHRINNTKGDFNPLTAYMSLFKWQLRIAASFCVTFMFGYLFYRTSGVYVDHFTGSKKFVIVSEAYQSEANHLLKDLVLLQISCHNARAYASPKVAQLAQYIQKQTGKSYQIITVQSQDHILVVLPNSIIISKKLLLSKELSTCQLKLCLLLMQRLFSRRYHIKQLSLSNIILYLKPNFIVHPFIDIKLLMIYSRVYQVEEVQQVVQEIVRYGVSEGEIYSTMKELLRVGRGDRSRLAISSRISQQIFDI